MLTYGKAHALHPKPDYKRYISLQSSEQNNLLEANMFIQQSGLSLNPSGYVFIPPKANEKCT